MLVAKIISAMRLTFFCFTADPKLIGNFLRESGMKHSSAGGGYYNAKLVHDVQINQRLSIYIDVQQSRLAFVVILFAYILCIQFRETLGTCASCFGSF